MVGTKAGGMKAAMTNKLKHGEGFYAKIGKKGGKNGKTGGFASEKIGKDGLTGFERARIAGQKGGSISRRGPAKKNKPLIERKVSEPDIQKSIHRWQNMFRNGRTVVEEDDAQE